LSTAAVPDANALYNKKKKNFSEKQKEFRDMVRHTPALKKVKKQGEIPLPSLSPIPLKKCRI